MEFDTNTVEVTTRTRKTCISRRCQLPVTMRNWEQVLGVEVTLKCTDFCDLVLCSNVSLGDCSVNSGKSECTSLNFGWRHVGLPNTRTSYPPQSHRFSTRLPRKRTCEYSTSTAEKKTHINRPITTSEIFSVNHHFRSHIHLFTVFKLSLKVFSATYTVVLGMCRTRLCDDICHIKNSDLICNAPAFLMQSVQLKPPTMTIMRIRNYN